LTIDRRRERTAFQTHVYDPAIDLRTDVVFVYGWDATFAERVALWRARGYRVHFMTGAAWGRYDEYLDEHLPIPVAFQMPALVESVR